MSNGTIQEMVCVANSKVEKSFTLRFLKPIEPPDEQQPWIWDPEKPLILNIKTATFSGKNKSDDYTNE